VENIRDTGSRRLEVQRSFGGPEWQTLQLEIAKPEADEIERAGCGRDRGLRTRRT
jgi:hypothetical protein